MRRRKWGAILSAVVMFLMTFSAVTFAPVPVIGELGVEDSSLNEESEVEQGEEAVETVDKIIPSDLSNLEWPEVYYPSGLGGNDVLGDDPPGSQSRLSDLTDRHGVTGAWAQGVDGSGVNVALIDTGIDMGNPNLIGSYATDETILGSVTNEIVVDGASAGGVTEASLANQYVINLDLRNNGNPLVEGIDYTLYDKEGRVVFASPLMSGDQITANYYDYTSPYYGWPIAFDPVSMSNFLEQNHTKDTWFANCTQVGTGPFEYSHTLIVDGETEFGGTYEKWGSDTRDNFFAAPGGNKFDYDLTQLNLTYDKDFWYVGFPTFIRVNMTGDAGPFVPKALFGVLFDVDNETGGTTTVPEGKLIDTNSSHSDKVLDVEFSPDGSMVATVSEDYLVRIWYASNGTRIAAMFDHKTTNNPPFSLSWSDDGTKLATISKDRVYIWNVGSWGSPAYELVISGVPDLDVVYGYSSYLAFSPNNTAVAFGG
ncbi:MAG: hypothetical protein KAW09_11125, partial [Thermoplasmata archaeon]|nr:hypothetical protein [Thermoplasmata archaeon]